MNVLVVGGGGREHALVWKIAQSPRVKNLYCAPGNGGIARMAECVDIDVSNINALIQFALKKEIDLTVVGPELPLTLGIVDQFEAKGLRVFGPSQAAAELEGSKVFAKTMMDKFKVPTAAYATFTEIDKAVAYVHTHEPPMVLKADGLAAGKGVILCHTRAEAFDGIEQIMKDRAFGAAGSTLVIEEFLTGEEASVLAIADGTHFVVLPAAQDHKAVFENDQGPNTGGMGAYAPAPVVTDKAMERIVERVIRPMLQGMAAEGRPYRGVLYAGMMMTAGGPKVLEFNCRFGDPETQPLLALLKSDIIDLFEDAIDGRLDTHQLEISSRAAVCVVMAAGGYPGPYEKGKVIHGLERQWDNVLMFHAGTKAKGKDIVTSGGRVLGITAVAETLPNAMKQAYEAVGSVTFDGAYYRRDIGQKALNRI